MTDREKLKAKLRALAAKTTANGCTEAEAASAMAAAARIMEAHGLDADDVERIESAPHMCARTREAWPYSFVWGTIASVTNCTRHYRWVHPAGAPWRYAEVYVGRAHDVVLAEYLRALCDRAIRTAQTEFRKSKAWRWKKVINSQGFAAGLAAGGAIALSDGLSADDGAEAPQLIGRA